MSATHDEGCRQLIRQAAMKGEISMDYVTTDDLIEIELNLMEAIRQKKELINPATMDEFASGPHYH